MYIFVAFMKLVELLSFRHSRIFSFISLILGWQWWQYCKEVYVELIVNYTVIFLSLTPQNKRLLF